jgi:hypothetical protein
LYYCKVNFKTKKMSLKKDVVKKLEIKDVYLDFPSVMAKISFATGIAGLKKPIGSVSEECGVSKVIVKQWESKAPNIVAILHAYMKKYDLEWSDLVKEVKSKKK